VQCMINAEADRAGRVPDPRTQPASAENSMMEKRAIPRMRSLTPGRHALFHGNRIRGGRWSAAASRGPDLAALGSVCGFCPAGGH
jgi:hypothetical protein